MATFNETRAPTSRKYAVKQSIVMTNWSKTFQPFWSYSSVFGLEIFIFSLSPKESLVATFVETCALTSRKNVAEKGMIIPKLSETLRLL